MKIENLDNILGTVLGNMYEVWAKMFTVYLRNGQCWTAIYFDVCCDYDPRLTTGYYCELDVDEDDNVFIDDWHMYPEEMYRDDPEEIIEIVEYKESTVAELYLHKTNWEAWMERRGS